MSLAPQSPIVIVGGGVAGLGLAWALARRGVRDITLVEREQAPFRLSSGLNAGILRDGDRLARDPSPDPANRQPPEGAAGGPR